MLACPLLILLNITVLSQPFVVQDIRIFPRLTILWPVIPLGPLFEKLLSKDIPGQLHFLMVQNAIFHKEKLLVPTSFFEIQRTNFITI